ncbi:MAG TPA: DNA internalization-related competence protein ComEC/Rec2 [Gemmatimonadaceae bacterium]|nr:DNA internalization-related competence protein ComEC/Rec2 [Gemmatimonadaceae bacterium]
MPLVAVAVLAYAAGLLGGLGLSVSLTGASGLALAIAGAARRKSIVFAGGASMLAAALVAGRTRVVDARCEHEVVRRGVQRAILDEDAAPGEFIHAKPIECTVVVVALAVAAGRAPAGSTVSVRGTLAPAQRGYVVHNAKLTLIDGPGWRARWRARADADVGRVFVADAPLARALLVADMRDLSPEIRDRYAAAGLAHMLSISGLHVGIIALALEALFQLLHLARRTATVAAIIVVAAYVALIGAPEAAVRSAAMLAVLGVSRLLQRPTSPWAMLAIGAATPLVSPRSVMEVGYQLSVIGVAALIAAGALVRRAVPRRIDGWRRTIVAGLVVSTVATIVSAPLVAWTFGRISLVGPLTNLVAAPLMTLAQPMLFLGLLLAPVPSLASIVADAVHPLLVGFDAIALAGASIPHGWIVVSPTVPAALFAAVASVALIVACVSQFPGRALLVANVAIVCLVWSGLTPTGSGFTEVHLIDVGQGDAIGLRTPHGSWLLIDAGRAWHGGDAGRSVVLPYLTRRRGRLVAFILSHPHTDHVGGAATVISALHPAYYYDAAFAGDADAYRESLLRARQAGAAWRRVHPGDSLVVDGVRLQFLGPDSSWTAGLNDPNLASTILLVRTGNVRMLLVGDAERPEEDWLVAHYGDSLHADVLKVGHHGSSTSSSAPFLDAVRPRIALVSVGAGNSYGHPSAAVMATLASRGAQVLRTDRLGTIVVRTDGQRLFVNANGEAWELPTSSRP